MVSPSTLVPWNRLYALKSYLGGAIWPVPLVALLVYQLFYISVHALNTWLTGIGVIENTAFLALAPNGARAMLGTVVTANLSFLVFTFSSLLVAIQVAGGQYTPRIIATTLLRDNVIRFTVGSFVFTIGFAQRVLSRMDDTVQQLDTFIGAILGVLSVMVFLFLIDYAARLLRPVSLVARVGEFGIEVIRSVYPNLTTRPRADDPPLELESPPRIVCHAGTSGVVLAANLPALVKLAQRAGGVIEFVPLIGDFLSVDEPLFRLYGPARLIEDHALRGAVALGTERTMEQDPTFSFRILVDIAIKALSAAINDPTTAVMAIDQLHRLLRLVGQRDLRGERFFDESFALGEDRRLARIADSQGLGGALGLQQMPDPAVRAAP
jgi:uncharacterized membrane protein